MRVRPMAAVAAAIAACAAGVAAFVMIVSAMADGPPTLRARRPAAAPAQTQSPVLTPAPAERAAAPEYPELLGNEKQGPETATIVPLPGPASPSESANAEAAAAGTAAKPEVAPVAQEQLGLEDRLRFALHKNEECMDTAVALEAIENASVGANMDELVRALQSLLAEEGWCEAARRALQAALDSAKLSRLALLEPAALSEGTAAFAPGLPGFSGGGGGTRPDEGGTVSPPGGGGGTTPPGGGGGGGTTPPGGGGGTTPPGGGGGTTPPGGGGGTTPPGGGGTTPPGGGGETPPPVGNGESPGGNGGSGYSN